MEASLTLIVWLNHDAWKCIPLLSTMTTTKQRNMTNLGSGLFAHTYLLLMWSSEKLILNKLWTKTFQWLGSNPCHHKHQARTLPNKPCVIANGPSRVCQHAACCVTTQLSYSLTFIYSYYLVAHINTFTFQFLLLALFSGFFFLYERLCQAAFQQVIFNSIRDLYHS